ncbi:hypothetical protein DFP72DRAFT_892675 [Ephemerocybe angulata]|uniref:Uncharacterized protein n=1 Tax=Ephemerocybe angulata TaxID=980116 RepID=A0A8H6M9D5_9AGAR|nr:hypothetical protein DFP72DRAFT_892675 [Tulosesus angulatus]
MKTSFALLSLASLALASSDGHKLNRRQHHSIARMRDVEDATDLYARGGNSRWTFYNTETGNEGACGGFRTNNQFVVARAQVDFQKSDCGKTISLQYEGKTAEAVIWDICPECPSNGLDLSKGLFTHFASESIGVLYGTWNFGSGGGAPADPKPTTTTTAAPKPTTSKPAESSTTATTTTTEKPKPTTEKPKPTTTSAPPQTTTTASAQKTTTTSKSSKSEKPSSTSSANLAAVTSDSLNIIGTECNLTVENGEMVVKCKKFN